MDPPIGRHFINGPLVKSVKKMPIFVPNANYYRPCLLMVLAKKLPISIIFKFI